LSLTLNILAGPHAGASLLPWEGKAVFGRGLGAHFLMPQDRFLSPSHFAIESSGEEFRIGDAGSANGTRLNGAVLTEPVPLHIGDTIHAGRSVFVAVAAMLTAQDQPGVVSAPRGPSAFPLSWAAIPDRASQVLAMEAAAFAIVDAARDASVLKLLESSSAQWQSLYEGEKAVQLRIVAPYLVAAGSDPAFLESLIHWVWGRNAGVFLSSGASFEQLRWHLRHLLTAEAEDGRRLLFRFYDPRVLRVYLPTCNPDELPQFFGPVLQFLGEDKQPDRLLAFWRDRDGLRREVAELTEEEPA
jgi:hypothetical protein